MGQDNQQQGETASTGQAQPSRRVSYKVIIGGLVIILPLLWVLFSGLFMDPHRMDAPLVGRNAPAFDLPELNSDGTRSLASYRGKPLVLNFFRDVVFALPQRASGAQPGRTAVW